MYLFNKGNKNNVFYSTFLGGYTGSQVRESASSSSSSNPSSNRSVKTTKKTTTTTPKTTTSSSTSTSKTTTSSSSSSKTTTSSTSNKSYGTALGGGSTVPKETLNRTTSSSNPSSNRSVRTTRTPTTSTSSSSKTTTTYSNSNKSYGTFLGGGSTVPKETLNRTTSSLNNPNVAGAATVSSIEEYLQRKVSYLQYNGDNPGGRVDNNFKPGVSLQTFDLTSDATNRGKNVTNTTTQKYKPVGQGSGGTFMGGYTGADVLKDAGITPTKNNESIFKKVGNFFKDTAKSIADKITGKDGTQTSKLNSTVVTNNQPEADIFMTAADSGMRPKRELDKARELERINAYQSITGRNYLTNYTQEDVDRLAALMFREAGGSFNHGSDEEWFAFLNTGAVAVNNAYDKGTGNTFSDKLCSLSNNVYQGLSSYATSDFDTVTKGASEAEKADLRKAAELVLSGQYTLPSNMHLQASESIVNNNGTSWNTHNVDHDFGYGNIHIGYDTGSTVSNTDIYGNKVSTDANDYRELAVELRNVSDSLGEGSTGYRDTKFPDITNPNNRANV